MTTSSSRRVPRTIEFFPVAFLETTSQDITYYGRSSARRMWSWSADVRWSFWESAPEVDSSGSLSDSIIVQSANDEEGWKEAEERFRMACT